GRIKSAWRGRIMTEEKNQLPNWIKSENEWMCDDPESERLAVIALLEDFSLPHFDLWLDEMPDGEKKTSWLTWRQETMSCRNQEALAFRFKFAAQVQRTEQWDRYVRPLAKSGKKLKDAAKLGHESTHGTREEKEARWQAYQRELEDLMRRNNALS